MGRTANAFFIAPLWVPIGVAIYAGLYLMQPSDMVTFYTVIAAVFGYAATFVLGCPAFLLLRSLGLTALWISVVFGFAIGVLAWISFVFLFAVSLGYSIPSAALQARKVFDSDHIILLGSGFLGIFVGLTLWLIARPDRPSTAD